MALATLLQYEICPFCSKVKGMLDFYRVPYRTIEVNPLSKQQLLSADFRAKKVPMLVLPGGSKVSDSPVILQTLWDQQIFRDKTVAQPVWSRWETFVDKKLAVVLFPNITRNFAESWQAFAYLNAAPGFSPAEKIVNQTLGSIAMTLANGRLKKKYGISDERHALYECITEWSSSLNGVFHGGSNPDEVDALVFSVLRSIEGL